MTRDRAALRLVILITVVVGMGAWTAIGSAETVTTSQARVASAEFLATATPPPSVGAICLIDTGVDQTPDTSRVVARISAWDDIVGDTSPTRHGTLVAGLLSAPRNDWGMVGIWPSGRVVSIRANTSGGDEFTVASYYAGLQRCDSVAGYYGINTILLALGSQAAPTEEEATALKERLANARAHGLSVVVAAGNNSGGPLETPAQLPGALAVGGAAADGSRCAISALGVALQALGCGVDAIDPASGGPASFQGTTASAAVTAAAISALRSYRPDLSPDAADQLVIATATQMPAGPVLNVGSAFRAAGLGALVDASPPLGTSPPPARPPDDGLPDLAPKSRLPRPQARVRRIPRHPRRISVRLRNLPKRAVADIAIAGRRGRGRARQLKVITRKRIRGRTARMPAPAKRAVRVTIRYRDPSGARLSSRPLVVRVAAAARRAR